MTFPLGRVFLHFFDPHFMGRDTAGVPSSLEQLEAVMATRLALLCAEQVFVPAASYVESDLCRNIIDSYAELFGDGVIQLVGGEDTFASYAQSKLLQYDSGSARYAAYQAASELGSLAPAFVTRQRNTTQDLHRMWNERIERSEIDIADLPDVSVSEFTRRWSEVSDGLGQRAFIPEYVMPLFRLPKEMRGLLVLENRIRRTINVGYFNSFVREFKAGVVSDLSYLSGFQPDPDMPTVPYGAIRRGMAGKGVLKLIAQATPTELRQLHEVEDIARILIPLVQMDSPGSMPTQLTLPIGNVQPDMASLRKVKRGRAHAHIYAKRIQTVLEVLFKYSLGPGRLEAPIHEGRKRIDILFPNIARTGTFRYAATRYGASMVIVECKNYTNDPANPEFDQLAMRFDQFRGRFGLLACRSIKDMDLAISRCRDAHRSHGALMVPITDTDLQQLVNAGRDPGLVGLNDSLLGDRILRVITGT